MWWHGRWHGRCRVFLSTRRDFKSTSWKRFRLTLRACDASGNWSWVNLISGWWWMMDDGWWVVTGGLIYAVFKIDVEKICWNIFERKVPGNSKWHKTRSPIVSGSQPNLWKGHSCHDRKRRTVMSRELPNLISTWNVTSIIRQESPETLKISTKI